MKTFQQAMWGMAAVGALVLSGCGGGGGGSSSDNNGDGDGGQQTVDRVSLTGVAVKGIMANALITVTSLDGSSNYGTTRTNALGRYSLADLNLAAGPVKVTMTTDASTILTCDSAIGCDNQGTPVNFGDTYSFNDPAFELTAILPAVGDLASIELMVTPVTHMAAERVQQLGSSSAEDIEGINRATANLLGLQNVDIIRDIPLDITNAQASQTASQDSRSYGAMVASFSTIAAASGDSLADVIDEITDDYSEDGGMIANASSNDVIDLETLFAGAADSAERAEDEGAQLGATELEFRVDEQQASHFPEDQIVIAEDTSTTPTEILTEEQAITKAIELLEDLNGWNTALTGQTTENTTTAYIDQTEALTDLLPVMDDQSQVLRGLRELIVEETTEGDTQDGQLLKHLDLIDQLISLSSYIQSNHSSLDPTANGDGSYTLTAQSLLNENTYLHIEQYLKDGSSNGNIPSPEEADLTMTYRLNDDDPERITHISFSGKNLVGTLVSTELAYTLEADSKVAYTLSNMKVLGSGGEDFDASGTLTMTFGSDADRTTFLNDRDISGRYPSLITITNADLSLTAKQKGLTGDSLDPDFEQATADLDITLTVNQSDNQLVDSTLTIDVDMNTVQEGFLRGILTTRIQGQHSESGSVITGFTNDIDMSDMDMSFDGSLQTKTQSGDTTTFTGKVGLAGADFEDNDPLKQSMSFDGEFTMADTSGSKLEFDGVASLKIAALKASDGKPLPDEDGLLLVPEEASFSGNVKLTSNSDQATANLYAIIKMDGYDELASLIAPVTFPEYNAKVAELVFKGFTVDSTDSTNNSAVVTLAHDLENATSTVQSYINSLGLTNIRPFVGAGYPEKITFTLGSCVDETTNPNDTLRQCNLNVLTQTPQGNTSSSNQALIVEQAIENAPSQWISVVMSNYFQGGSVQYDVWSDEGYFKIGATVLGGQNDFGSNDSPLVVDLKVQEVNLSLNAEDIFDRVETESIYRGMSVAADVDTKALNLEDGNVRVTMERLGLDDASARLRVSYGDRDIDLVIDSVNGLTSREATHLVISDADSRMDIVAKCATLSDPDEVDIQTCVGDIKFEGDIFVGDFKVGSLQDREGFPVFTFSDPNNRQFQLVVTPNFLVSELQ